MRLDRAPGSDVLLQGPKKDKHCSSMTLVVQPPGTLLIKVDSTPHHLLWIVQGSPVKHVVCWSRSAMGLGMSLHMLEIFVYQRIIWTVLWHRPPISSGKSLSARSGKSGVCCRYQLTSDNSGQRVTMQRTGHARLRSEEAAVQKLAEDVRTETSLDAIVGSLKALCRRLDDEARADHVALVFMRAGGLPALIRHLGGFATSADPETTAWVRNEAAEALRAVMGTPGEMEIMAELRTATGVIAPLVDVLRGPPDIDSPHVIVSCSVACDTLLGFAVADRVHREAMADGGVIRLCLGSAPMFGTPGAQSFMNRKARWLPC